MPPPWSPLNSAVLVGNEDALSVPSSMASDLIAAVGGGVAAAGLALGAAWLLLRRRRQKLKLVQMQAAAKRAAPTWAPVVHGVASWS